MIDTMFMLLRKTMVALMFVVFGFAATYIPQVHTTDQGTVEIANIEYAQAGGVFLDPVNLVQNTITAVQTAATWVVQNWIYLKESVLDGIAWAIAKQIISMMVSDIVDWINSGFEGSPAFVQNFGDFLLEAADVAIGEYINELGGDLSFICDPFKLDVQLAVAFIYDYEREDRRPSCTLTGIVDNFENFIEGAPGSGGWADWFSITAEPNSTPYGAILTARSEARARILDAQGNEVTKLDWGKGFMSFETCVVSDGDAGGQEECFINTPGDVLAQQLNKAVGAGQDQLVAADEFNEIIAALIGQLAQTIVSGVGLFGSSGGYTSYSRGSFVDDLTDGTIDGTGTGGGTVGGTTGVDINAGVGSALNYISQGIDAQETVNASINTYISDLQNFISNPLNSASDRELARIALNEALGISTRVDTGLASSNTILTQYAALEAEYANATPARQTEIRNLQGDLVQQFSTLNLVTTAEYNIYTSRWNQLLARNVEPFVDPCQFDLNAFDPNCIDIGTIAP